MPLSILPQKPPRVCLFRALDTHNAIIDMISAEEARKIVVDNTTMFRSQIVPLRDAHDRILASDIRSNDDIPPFRNSSMDGFAVRSDDTVGATDENRIELPIQSEIAAGDWSARSLSTKKAIRILTGAPLPEGADAVVPVEYVKERKEMILLSGFVGPGQNTREKGEDIRKGEVVLRLGTIIKAPHLGILASIGCAEISVFEKPKLAILTTGNELLSVAEKLEGGKIRNSNAYSLRALAIENDCEPVDLGVARDDEVELLDKIRKGLKYDILVTSGGVSAGKYDYVLEAMKKAGVDLKFWKVNIKPGMPLAFGIHSSSGISIPVFCLPGNPVSTVVTFLGFVRPCIEKMMSSIEEETRLHLRAILEHSLKKSDGKRHYHRGMLQSRDGRLYVRSTGNQSSGVLSSMVKANCLIILKEEESLVEAGSEVDVELFT